MQIADICFYSGGKKISARLGLPDRDSKNAPGIVLNHGYSGDKEEYDAMAGYLCSRGFVTLQFDSRGCGGSEALKGRMMCATEWHEDAHSAVSFLQTVEGVNKDSIGFAGCSMGGAVTLYMAAKDPRVKCAVALAPFAYSQYVRQNWLKNAGETAYASFLNELHEDALRTACGNASKTVPVPYALGMNEKDTKDYCEFRDMNPQMVCNVPLESVYHSLIINDPYIYADMIRVPFMVIQGDADTIIPPESAYRLIELIRAKKEFVLINAGEHALPTSDQKETVFEHAARWFVDNLF